MNIAQRKIMKAVAIAILSVIGAALLVVIGYLVYVLASFYRLPDNIDLEVKNNTEQTLSLDRDYTIMTYNVGFGAYGPTYSFFMDTGIMKDGTKTQGEHGIGVSAANVEYNITGSANTVAAYSPDFAMIEEVDYNSTRSYGIDKRKHFSSLEGYASVFAENYHSSFLYFPFNEPHGRNFAGIMTLSKYKIASSVRRSFPIDSGLSKLTDLDRCFSLTRIPAGDKELVLISLHMSAYDEGGVIRKAQTQMLVSVLDEEYKKGNYVIAGGDFNQDLIGDLEMFESAQAIPEWVASFAADELPEGFSIAKYDELTVGSCRGADIPWQRGYTYTCVIDGFIVSDNIATKSVRIIDNDFAYSDHNPVLMRFALK